MYANFAGKKVGGNVVLISAKFLFNIVIFLIVYVMVLLRYYQTETENVSVVNSTSENPNS